MANIYPALRNPGPTLCPESDEHGIIVTGVPQLTSLGWSRSESGTIPGQPGYRRLSMHVLRGSLSSLCGWAVKWKPK